MKKLLFILETTSITDPHYRQTFDQLIKSFNQHIQRFKQIYFVLLFGKFFLVKKISIYQY